MMIRFLHIAIDVNVVKDLACLISLIEGKYFIQKDMRTKRLLD